MFRTLRDAWKIPELRKKLIATILILLIYRVVAAIPVPYMNAAILPELRTMMDGNILGLYNTMSGGALASASLLALGIQPYINASIIIQLLAVAIPALERLSKEGGEEGKKKIEKITRISTVVLGLILGYAYYTMCKVNGVLVAGSENNFWHAVVIILAFTAGACFAMWLGEQITEHGIGNGISMILFANIIAGLPQTLQGVLDLPWWAGILVAVILAALIVFIVFINDAERRIPIQYAKRTVGRKVMGGQSTNLPIKVAMSGVMPVIFAQSIVSIGATVMQFIANSKADPEAYLANNWLFKYIFSPQCAFYAIAYFLLIFFFSWFYSTIQYDPTEIAKNLQKNGGFIPGFRAGKPTANFIKKVINKILIFGAIYLAIVALLPVVGGIIWTQVQNLAIGGTSIIIVVGVALETVKAIEAQMLMRHYKGFLD